MEEFVKKMIREKEDVEGKKKHLTKALESSNYRISDEEKKLIEEQLGHMSGYLETLNKRISLHTN